MQNILFPMSLIVHASQMPDSCLHLYVRKVYGPIFLDQQPVRNQKLGFCLFLSQQPLLVKFYRAEQQRQGYLRSTPYPAFKDCDPAPSEVRKPDRLPNKGKRIFCQKWVVMFLTSLSNFPSNKPRPYMLHIFKCSSNIKFQAYKRLTEAQMRNLFKFNFPQN